MLDKYNAFEHLCASVFPIGARERIVTMLTVYADESGTDGRSPLVAVGGYISTKDKWDSFQEKWDDFCSKNDIGIFHATDLIAQRGEFSGWTKKRAESAFRIADNLISEHVLYGAVGYTTIAACEKVFPLKHPERGKRRKQALFDGRRHLP